MKARGFTLIEVLIAIGVIGILSAIALPIYRGYVAKAEAASVTVAGLSSNFQSQLDAAESNTGTSNSGTASAPTPPTTTVSTGQTGGTDTSNSDTSAPSSNSIVNASTNSGSTEPSATTSTDSTNSTPPANVSASGSGGSNARPSAPTIGVPEAFQDCDPCGIGKKKTVQIAFDLSSFGTLDADSIASGKTGSAITGNPTGQYNADNGQYVVTIRTHDQKSKTGTLSVSIDGQSTTINLKTI